MPDHLQSFQLDFLTPDLFQKIVKKAVVQGTRIPAAHGNYIYFHMGDMLLVIRTAFDPEKGLDYITGFDSHAKGCCVWDCVIDAVEERADGDVTARTVRVERGGAVLPLPLINGDILPDWGKGTSFQAQVAAYPTEISFFEEEKTARNEGGGDFRRIVAAGGDDVVIRGEAKGFRRGETSYMGGTLTRFLVALVATEAGDIELVFPDRLVTEGEEALLRPGVFLRAKGELAANPAILGREKGFPKEEEA